MRKREADVIAEKEAIMATEIKFMGRETAVGKVFGKSFEEKQPFKLRKEYDKLRGDIEYDLWYHNELKRRKERGLLSPKKTEETVIVSPVKSPYQISEIASPKDGSISSHLETEAGRETTKPKRKAKT